MMLAHAAHFALNHVALARIQLLPPPSPLPAPPSSDIVLVRRPVPVLRLVPPEPDPVEVAPSAWDPEPVSATVPVCIPVPERRIRTLQEEELLLQEINGVKTLLLEIIRRAAYDWVLYRGSRRMVQRTLAEQAYRWLFLEMEGTSDWNDRIRDGKMITSFVSVCESLDLDPCTVRKHIKRLTPKGVMSVGRPAEYRRRDVFSGNGGDEDAYSLPENLVEYVDDSVPEETLY
jgi:hypothetical protein